MSEIIKQVLTLLQDNINDSEFAGKILKAIAGLVSSAGNQAKDVMIGSPQEYAVC